ncbi:general negative regulator of transcription subunit 3-like isoform X2 [Andrographis paniculata]|uniref:general negative regulator of transcription subunit 3-like isoform X2 n=1 Tax=Andrographis paniculata TaxID=175694 RepID=UPI0021E87A62|nr:general negative regulator of transcription subunit 3-like isoform X2 [Andrographis paniculata]
MGASRKLQGEIDRVLKKVQEGVDVFDSIWNKVYDTDNANQKEKFEADLKKEIKKLQRYRDQIKTWIQSSEIKDKKVSASYEQALIDARKQIEREMERFKICEKETKTKAFSKEGLGQQPKTDPKEKAKSETREWLNNVVSVLENQIDSYEAEIEGLSVKKGKTRPPRLTHLETSIARHKAHIMKLELILRLLDNDELSPEQVNDVKDFLDDYVERNQEAFDEFSDVDELYSSLPLDKVEALEELVTIGPPGLMKGVGASNTVLSMKTSLAAAPAQAPPTTSVSIHVTSTHSQVDETAFQDNVVARTPPPKSGAISSSVPQSTTAGHATTGMTVAAGSSSPLTASSVAKEEESANSPGPKVSPAPTESGIRTAGRGGTLPAQPTSGLLGSGNTTPSNGSLGAIPLVPEIVKKATLGSDDRSSGNGMVQSLVSPLSNKVLLLPQSAKASEGLASAETVSVSDTAVMGNRVFSSPMVPGTQWRPGSPFQSQNEQGQFRGRAEIAPDQREKFLQRFQQVQQQQQQSQANLLGMPLTGGKQYSSQQQSILLPQFNVQSSSISPQLALGIGVQASGVTSSASLQQQPNAIQSSNHQPTVTSTSKDAETGQANFEDMQQKQSLVEDPLADFGSNTGTGKSIVQEDDLKASYTLDSVAASASGSLTEPSQVIRETDLSPGQLLQSSSSSGSLGVIGRRSVSDLGAIGDNISALTANSGGMHDQVYNLQMLEAAYYKLPQPRDSERAKTYTPRHPAVTIPSYPQVQAPIVNNPAFWERLGADTYGTDALFFSFYYQQNTYQQYLAAKELKKQSWRYHRKYNTWFQRHEEPKVATEDFEQGTYVYFDFHITNDEQHGWCQRIKTEFTFEYSYLEDELMV